MRIVLAGATGVIGARLVPLLLADGHDVVGLTRTPSNVAAIEAAGAMGVAVDILDPTATRDAIMAAGPDLVMHQVTDLPDRQAGLLFKVRALGRVRTLGTDSLIAAASAAGARVLAQSVAFATPGPARRPLEYLEHAVLDADGLVLRYGRFYGPGTWSEEPPKAGQALHVDAAARMTVDAMVEPSGILEVLDSGVTRVA
ncbi:NAD-dependent epimerase/dehydratase family protein [Demequina sp. NBRC 110056]|uniref:NAD-dependent epimerase/dehydratase family protein n=1 Tax=Demequina sp. NBRC 110056 TaxID=1570345 RepID=UPI000A0681FD|nr:NAD-dependent epimerase/dehydratase family protein [Demequina sp. NBRC 110056]